MMALIFRVSSLPAAQIPNFGLWDLLVKKSGHVLGYILLGATNLHAIANGRRVSVWHVLLAVAGACLYAVTDEYHQSFVNGRHATAVDVMIDTSGATISAAAVYFIQTLARPARPRPPSTPQ